MDLNTTVNDDEPEDDPTCAECGAPCGKSLGARRQTVNTFWGGNTHGSKVFYTHDHTDYFCSEVHRTEFFWGDAGVAEFVPG